MRNIKKTVNETIIYAAIVAYVNNKLTATDLQPLATVEKVTEAKAVKLVKDNFPEAEGKTIIIKSIETNPVTYTMDSETFFKYAVRNGEDSEDGEENEPEEMED